MFNSRTKLSRIVVFAGLFCLLHGACTPEIKEEAKPVDWQEKLENTLPLLGHRNWILVVDKAFPLQNGAGIAVVYAPDSLLNVLQTVLYSLRKCTHIKPLIYTDAEMDYLDPSEVKGLAAYKESLQELLPEQTEKILHDSVFVKIKKASELFSILVLKTDEVIPYSSVFLELDCKYWTPEQEKSLRMRMP